MNRISFKKAVPHVVAIVIFLAISLVYFSPQTKGLTLRAGDYTNYVGMSQEIRNFRDVAGEDPLWTNSMFCGMPAYQIDVENKTNYIRSAENIILDVVKSPAGLLFIAMLSFYIMLILFGISPWISILGSVAYGLSTINILYLGAGHYTRVHAIALMPAVIGGVFYTYRKNMIIGAVLTALFVCLEISANHIQETYYLLFLIAGIIGFEFFRHIREKMMKKFFIASGLLVAAGIIGVLPTMSNLMTTNEYGKYTTRSQTELTIIQEVRQEEQTTSGLERWYITEYNFGVGELWSLVIPNVKGGESSTIFSKLVSDPKNQKEIQDFTSRFDPKIAGPIAYSSNYWGEQTFTGGAFYFGAVIFMLFILGMIFIKDQIKWVFLGVVVLSLSLAIHSGAMIDFFISYFPLFNKFRDSKLILVLVQMIFSLVGIMFLHELFTRQIERKKVLIASGIITGVFILFYLMPGTFFNFFSSQEKAALNDPQAFFKTQPMAKQGFDYIKEFQGIDQPETFEMYKSELEGARIDIFSKDLLRTILFLLLTGALIFAYMKLKFKQQYLIIGLGLLLLIDLWTINKRYLNNEKDKAKYLAWQEPYEKYHPFAPTKADIEIFKLEAKANPQLEEKIQAATAEHFKNNKIDGKNKAKEQEKIAFRELAFSTNYRVYTLESAFTNPQVSYYHKSLGGYHGAKLGKYQELIDFKITPEDRLFRSVMPTIKSDSAFFEFLGTQLPVLNMLNTKYIIVSRDAAPLVNPFANGNAWAVEDIKVVKTADEEMASLISPEKPGEVVELYKLKNEKETELIRLKKENAKPTKEMLKLFEEITGLRDKINGLNSFDSKNTAIINEKYASLIEGKKFVKDSATIIKMTEYKPNHLTFDYSAKTEQFVVFSEIFYDKGWNVYINGEQADYCRVNYVLRGMVVPAGKYTIEWKFEPSSYYTGKTISMLGSILLILILLGALGLQIKKSMAVKPREKE
ncbi:MAG: hypothetical protein A2W91_13540 [Bacteroidetes bacterium GWF2_38_335]|nr:MAG: hypothetical protein A2W91_13540 [Bacteroidetes bacterium GWF2_38_335]OFY77275.1 MAG: hypothetical protein A2281_15205 [Bacteroidetes bacterium RIFOXYA12_FULL_38_20]HBS85721.1 hypothetical protein [Bacteroidales bacterium]